MAPHIIIEESGIAEYLVARNLLKQYIKAKQNVLSGNNARVYFRERQPKGCGTWYFRINRQFRAFGRYEGTTLIVYEIDNHQ